MPVTKAKITALLELIDDLVNGDDTVPWALKRDAINGTAKEYGHETALLEFLSWFPEDEG